MPVDETEKKEIEKICLEHGAAGVRFIPPENVIVAHWTRLKCQYGCGSYNKSHCCPPRAPAPEETRKIMTEYGLGLLVHFSGEAEVTKTIVALERILFLRGYFKAIGFGAGPCTLCDECDKDGCIYPAQARPSMEACGIDVYSTVKNSGFALEVLAEKNDRPDRYGLLLLE